MSSRLVWGIAVGSRKRRHLGKVPSALPERLDHFRGDDAGGGICNIIQLDLDGKKLGDQSSDTANDF
jgi:hypothetical protein